MDRLRLYEENNAATRIATQSKAKTVLGGPDEGRYRLQGLVSIPVVVHIVLPNPFLVTDADVQEQIDRLNQDFAGLNADSTNGAGFYNVRGHSQIRFCLARRTPAGQLTTGIERRVSGTGSDASATNDPIKRTVLGGLDAWNTADYLNLWVGSDATGQGILGYADNIGTGNNLDDGVFLNYQSFGSSSCYTMSQYNRGRTGTHEIGHYLGLYHIWGDDNGGCNGDDFAQLPASTNCTLPNGLFNPAGSGNGAGDIGDTPNQGDATTSCPNGSVTDDCAATAPGKMYQNHMDYTQDACLSMFTQKQVARMEWLLDNCRTGLKNSLGCQPPADAVLLDVAPFSSVNPGGFELVGCQTVYYTDTMSCPASLTPKFRVVNNGLSPITSLTAGYSYDNGTAVTQAVSVNLPQGGSVVVSFAPIPVTIGTHSLRFFTSAPNGSTDQVTANDSYTQNFAVMAPTAPPLIEGLETTLPLSTWTVDNPDFDFTWHRTMPGRNGSAGKLSIDNYHLDGTANRDDFRSTAITVDPAAAYNLTFDVAHKNYPDPQYADSLSVLVSSDCGQTFTRVFIKGGTQLATAGTSEDDYSMPADTDWRTESVSLNGSLLSSGKIVIVFRNRSGYGNWVHLDNINLVKVGARDLQLTGILSPGSTACSGTIAPSVTLENVGLEAVTSFSVGYRIDNGPVVQKSFTQTIDTGATVTVTLPQSTTQAGMHSITAFSFNPVTTSGTGDTRLANDTLRKSFTVTRLAGTPLVEDFETTFPSTGWTVSNPDNDVTWVRTAPGKASRYSVFFDNYNNNVQGETDDLRTPFIDVAGADSVLIRFDVAHKNYTDAPGDNLSVLLTTDCANSFTSVYSKTGAALATAGSTTNEYSPGANDWRTESLALNAQALASGSVGLIFRNTNGFGNNVYLDNLQVSAVYKRDLQVVAVQQPTKLVCSAAVTPSVTVRNLGTDTVKAFNLVYSVNNGAAISKTITGLALPRGAETTITLEPFNGLVPGTYNFRVNTAELVTTKGTGDINLQNDTLRLNFSVPGATNAPLVENFATQGFPADGWSVLNSDASYTWQRYENGNGNQGSAFLNTFNYLSIGQKDELVSPAISFGTVDSIRLNFDLAAAAVSHPVGSNPPVDTLEVLVTRDCGNSFTTVYKKWGETLQTLRNGTPSAEFFPGAASEWRTESVDISAFADKSPLVVYFRVTNNNENNIFLDNISVTTKILPDLLKQKGYLLYPSPFRTSFVVWHYQTPADLIYIRVMNAVGQTLWTKTFSGNATKQEAVDLAGKPAGIYFVEMGYSGGKKAVTQRVVKE